jgi:hypothetical protein
MQALHVVEKRHHPGAPGTSMISEFTIIENLVLKIVNLKQYDP